MEENVSRRVQFTKLLLPKNSGLKQKAVDAIQKIFGNREIETLEFRGEDIPFLVEEFNKRGIAAIGLTGNDTLQEYLSRKQSKLKIIQSIPWVDKSFLFKKPCLCLLMPEKQNIGESAVVAVNKKFERLSENFLEKLRKKVLRIQTIVVSGNTEALVKQGLADACVEIVCTGKSLEENGLKIIERFFESDLVLIGYGEKESSNALEKLSEKVKRIISENNEGSYTVRVVKNGLTLKKLNEECFELIKAAQEARKSKIVWETADLLYFLSIVLAEKNVQLQEIWNELGRRELEKQQTKNQN